MRTCPPSGWARKPASLAARDGSRQVPLTPGAVLVERTFMLFLGVALSIQRPMRLACPSCAISRVITPYVHVIQSGLKLRGYRRGEVV